MKRGYLVNMVGVLLGACAGTAAPVAESDAALHVAERLYPMAEGNVWSYNIDTGEGTPTLGITRVVRRVGNTVEVSANGQAPQSYELRDAGIFRSGKDAWLLRNPIRVGVEWPSSQGNTARVVSVSDTVETPAGEFARCVRVQESGGDDTPTVTTTYCPDVGPVLISSSLQLQHTGTGAEVVGRLLGFEVARGGSENPPAM